MDLISPLLTDPGAPRLTVYASSGRMEFSARTLDNWAAKVANLLAGLGAGPGSAVALSADPGWQPVMIALGAWRIGAGLVHSWTSAGPQPCALFTDCLDTAESGEAAGVPEVYLLSTDPFGRGVEECGGELPFGINDFTPELRPQPDAYGGPQHHSHVLVHPAPDAGETGPVTSDNLRELAGALAPGTRWVAPTWNSVHGLARLLAPLAAGGSVVISEDATPARLEHLAAVEKATICPSAG